MSESTQQPPPIDADAVLGLTLVQRPSGEWALDGTDLVEHGLGQFVDRNGKAVYATLSIALLAVVQSLAARVDALSETLDALDALDGPDSGLVP